VPHRRLAAKATVARLPDASIHDLGPNHKLDPPLVVEVLHDGTWFGGLAHAWRGQRVQVTFTVAPGMSFSRWEPAERVRRTGNDEQRPTQPKG